ncbi:MAG: 1,4-dihydroxy-2-naphthoate octaprenyltransferase [Verrucomicrobiaceae bacterium]|nr:1,4-dihydroxy-2-naphthoate octaprenyltransferase [Verrucomicrobiaceae bacterium]
MATLSDWIDAARPKTLGAAVAPVIVGTAIGWRFGGALHWGLAASTLLSCMALQVATNWFNDAIDFEKGSDTAARIGPRRITASGVVTSRQAILAALLMLGVATAFSLPLLFARGWPILAIGVPSLYFCYGYTGGPAPLAYRGLGELFVILFFGLVAVTGSAFVQSGQWLVQGLVAGVQVGCLSTVLIAINNLRDIDEDRSTSKRTLAARFGVTFARWEITMLVVIALALQSYWWAQGVARVPVASLVMGLIGVLIIFQTWRLPPGKAYNGLLALSGIYLLLFAVTLVVCLTAQ